MKFLRGANGADGGGDNNPSAPAAVTVAASPSGPEVTDGRDALPPYDGEPPRERGPRPPRKGGKRDTPPKSAAERQREKRERDAKGEPSPRKTSRRRKTTAAALVGAIDIALQAWDERAGLENDEAIPLTDAVDELLDEYQVNFADSPWSGLILVSAKIALNRHSIFAEKMAERRAAKEAAAADAAQGDEADAE